MAERFKAPVLKTEVSSGSRVRIPSHPLLPLYNPFSPFLPVTRFYFLDKPRRRRLNLLTVTVVSFEASSAAPVGPLLGQYQIPIADFINLFNESCDLFSEESELPTLVFKSYPIPFMFHIRRPTLTFMLYSLAGVDRFGGQISIALVYDLVRLISTYDTAGDLRRSSRIVLSFLRSTGLSIA